MNSQGWIRHRHGGIRHGVVPRMVGPMVGHESAANDGRVRHIGLDALANGMTQSGLHPLVGTLLHFIRCLARAMRRQSNLPRGV